MTIRKAVAFGCSVMGAALLAGGTTLAQADKGGNGKGRGNPADIGAIHNIPGGFGNQVIGNGPPGGNSGRSPQEPSTIAVHGFSNSGGNGRSNPGAENTSSGPRQGKDVKNFQDKDFRGKDAKDFRGKDVQDSQGEKDKDSAPVVARASDKASEKESGKSSDKGSGKPGDKESGKSSDKESGKSREDAEEEAGRSESASTETKATRSTPLPNCT